MNFYQDLASDYDLMTRLEERLDQETEVIKAWASKYDLRSAIDAGCGTGIYTMALARLGVETTGADLSPEMIAQAEQNAKAHGVKARFVTCPLQELDKHIGKKADAVFCLGNSLPHLLSIAELKKTLAAFSRVLPENGLLVIQLLNYDKVLVKKERLVGIHRKGNKEFIRFYDFIAPLVRFNVLTINREGSGDTHKFTSTELHPYCRHELTGPLQEAGFGSVETFGDLKSAPFNKSESPNLVVIARKENNGLP